MIRQRVADRSLHVVEGAPLPYLVSRPATRQAGPSPLLCFLHGYDEAAPLSIERALTRHGPLAPRSSPLARARFVIVAPQLPRAGDHWHRYGAAVAAIVEAEQSASQADRAQTYLTGFSFGGNGVFDLALGMPGHWAALWAVDPTRVPARDPGLPIWLSVGEAARPRRAGFVRALGLGPAPRDRHANPDGSRLYLDEGLGHVASAASAYADERIYGWLLSRAGTGPR